jgi:hypothetical protein
MNFLPHQLLGINFDRSNNLNVLFVFFLLSSTYFSGLSSSFRLLISSFCACAFSFPLHSGASKYESKMFMCELSYRLFSRFFFSSRVCMFVRSLLKASSLCQMFEHLYVFVFVRYLSQCWHLFLVID